MTDKKHKAKAEEQHLEAVENPEAEAEIHGFLEEFEA
jgi:hypothetical protein